MAYTGEQQTGGVGVDLGTMSPGHSIYECKENPVCHLGTRLVLGDRVFRYAKNGGSLLVCAKVVQAPIPEATYSIGQNVGTHAVGIKEITWTVNASGAVFTKDQFADGYFLVDDAGSDATEEGYAYKIKSNTAQATVGSNSTLTLYDRLAKAITATATGAIALCPYNGTLLDAATSHLVGVPVIEVTASYYYWVQTWGPCAVVCDGTGVSLRTAITSTAGEADVRDADTEPIIGYPMNAGAANDVVMVHLTISP